jgi:hypothetical protein
MKSFLSKADATDRIKEDDDAESREEIHKIINEDNKNVKKAHKREKKKDLENLEETAREVADATVRVSKKLNNKKAEDKAERNMYHRHTKKNQKAAADLKK